MRRHGTPILLFLTAVLLLTALRSIVPARAQDFPLATNTPSLFATNTPPPPAIIPETPSAPQENYALRLWSEPGMVELLARQVRQLGGEDEAALVVQITQTELARRFPNAPSTPRERAALLATMLAAPPGQVDMRSLYYRFLEDTLSAAGVPLNAAGVFELDGWRFELIPVNVDNRPPIDAVIHSRYPAQPAGFGGGLRYEDYVFVGSPSPGAYRVFRPEVPYPAAPLGAQTGMTLYSVGDVTGDGSDDLALLVESGALNQRLHIFGWRGDGVSDLIAPGTQALVGQIVEWTPAASRFTAEVYRVESPRWGCRSEQTVAWTLSLNYFRPQDASSGFVNQPTMACTLVQAEPIFGRPLPDAISYLESLIAAAPDDPAVERVRVGLGVLYGLAGQAEAARSAVSGINSAALRPQIDALTAAVASSAPPAQVCAAVVSAAETRESALCDIDALLTRLLTEMPLRRDAPISQQLAERGIEVLDQVTIQQLGRLDRPAVRFDLAGVQWWAFAPLDPDAYRAERISAPPGFETPPASDLPADSIPAQALDAFAAGDLAGTLLALDNAARAAPGTMPTLGHVFLRALCQELLGDRAAARSGYYALWRDHPASIWGQLAAAHLERRL